MPQARGMGFRGHLNLKLIALIAIVFVGYHPLTFAFNSYESGGGEASLLTPGDEFLYFVENKSITSPRYYRENPHMCEDTTTVNANKSFVCSILSPSHEAKPYSTSELYMKVETDAVFFGEGHHDVDSQFEFSEILKQLHGQCYTTLAMEMFPASSQESLDQFFNNEISFEDIMTVFGQHWFYKNKEGYRQIIKTAKSLNMRIIGLDEPKLRNVDVWKDISDRDDFMSDVLADEILDRRANVFTKNPCDTKVVVYAGRKHAVKTFGAGLADGLSQKLVNKLQSQNYTIQTENFGLIPFHRSAVYKGILSYDRQLQNSSVIATHDDYSYIMDAIIYVQPNDRKHHENQLMSSLDGR